MSDLNYIIAPVGGLGRPSKNNLLYYIKIALTDLVPALADPGRASDYADKILSNAAFVVSSAGLVAFYANDTINKQAFITMVAVQPNMRRRGVAFTLVTAALDFMRSSGFTNVKLDVLDKNETALRLYKRLGFSQVSNNSSFITMQHMFSGRL